MIWVNPAIVRPGRLGHCPHEPGILCCPSLICCYPKPEQPRTRRWGLPNSRKAGRCPASAVILWWMLV
jgi:hypothetical protein